MSAEKNNPEVTKMKQALTNMVSLADEVEQGLFLPKRFRKAPFTPEKRERYVKYLRKEAEDLQKRIEKAAPAEKAVVPS